MQSSKIFFKGTSKTKESNEDWEKMDYERIQMKLLDVTCFF